METLKHDAMGVISKLPETANIDDIMYELYVIDKVRKGKEAADGKSNRNLTTCDNRILTTPG